MKKNFLCLIGIVTFVIFSCFQSSVKAEEICMTSCDWAPYTAENLKNYGFTAEIIKAALKQVGYTVTFKFFPWKRALKTVLGGKCDAVFSAYYSAERAEKYALSDPYIEGGIYLCTLKDKNIEYKTLKDLAPYNIGVVLGYANTDEFDSADYLKKDPAPSDLLNLKKLIKGRTDLIVIDKYVALHNLKNSPYLEGDLRSIKFLEPPLKVMPVHAMFSKAIPGYEKKVSDFNKGLKEIKENGTLDKILQDHGFLDPD